MAGEHQHGMRDTPRCPDDETVAAYLDRRLSDADAARVDTHLAGCDRCVELLAAIAAGVEVVEDAPAEGRWPQALPFPAVAAALVPESSVPTRLRPWMVMAASIVVVTCGAWALRSRDTGPGLETLRAATVESRPIQGRLWSFTYAPPAPIFRSAAAGAPAASALTAAAAAVTTARVGRADVASLHAYGVAQLVTHDLEGATSTLARAIDASPRDVSLLNDASVAWIEKAQAAADPAALQQARRLAERAIALGPGRPEGWFNLALVGRLALDEPLAARARARLRAIEAGSPWAGELDAP